MIKPAQFRLSKWPSPMFLFKFFVVTVIGAQHSQTLVTINERKSRYALLHKVVGKQAANVRDAIIEKLQPFAHLAHFTRASITGSQCRRAYRESHENSLRQAGCEDEKKPSPRNSAKSLRGIWKMSWLKKAEQAKSAHDGLLFLARVEAHRQLFACSGLPHPHVFPCSFQVNRGGYSSVTINLMLAIAESLRRMLRPSASQRFIKADSVGRAVEMACGICVFCFKFDTLRVQ